MGLLTHKNFLTPTRNLLLWDTISKVISVLKNLQIAN